MDLAEDRDRFNELMDEIGVRQPEGGTAQSEDEALELADDIGYPVLVRPSYVLGGRAMEVVWDELELREYMEEAVRVSPDHPILIDNFLADAVELDVDAVSDGENVLIGGIMEHIEAAGVHSGDSACVLPPQNVDEEVLDEARDFVRRIARPSTLRDFSTSRWLSRTARSTSSKPTRGPRAPSRSSPRRSESRSPRSRRVS